MFSVSQQRVSNRVKEVIVFTFQSESKEDMTRNNKVDHWSFGVRVNNYMFKLISGVANTLADTLSRVVKLDLMKRQIKETR